MPQNNSRRGGDDDFSFTIEKHFGVLSTTGRGWLKEFNAVAWNGREAKYDIREWQPDHQKMSKGVTMTREEVCELFNIMKGNAAEFSEDDDVPFDQGAGALSATGPDQAQDLSQDEQDSRQQSEQLAS
ncbi:MAG: PC4/YdbC family ssDNA-binding protein [Anaerovoracaceae bacterium]|nr:PC4/YdbC family ssDNA-binding protein [Anaerovoracaceae bacterium]